MAQPRKVLKSKGDNQCGMKGKQMIGLIFILEAKVVDYIVRNVPNSGIFALDIASAFSSLRKSRSSTK